MTTYRAIEPSGATELGRSIIGLSGYPNQYLGWKQFRALGAAALGEGVADLLVLGDVQSGQLVLLAADVAQRLVERLGPLHGVELGRRLRRRLHPVLLDGAVVVFESTVYPGVTEEICGPALERASGLKCGADFKLGYSPERINPGDKEHPLEKIIKVVAGQDAEAESG